MSESLPRLRLWYEGCTQPLELPLYPEKQALHDTAYVLQDKEYTFTLCSVGENNFEVKDKKWCCRHKDKSYTIQKLQPNYRPFLFSYFTEEIEILCDGRSLYTNPVRVLIPENAVYMEQLCHMHDFIQEKEKSFGLNIFSKKSNYTKFSQEHAQERQDVYDFKLLHEICTSLQENYSAFAHNAQKQTQAQKYVGPTHKLRNIHKSTIQYMLNHPQHLGQDSKGCIPYADKVYSPQKTLLQRAQYHYDIYENQVILSFIAMLLRYVQRKIHLLKDHKSVCPVDDYVYSSFESLYAQYMENKFQALYETLSLWHRKYERVIPSEEKILYAMPRPSAIFLEVRHYRNIFANIKKWFFHGGFDTPTQLCMPFYPSADKIYEYYCLFHLLEALKSVSSEQKIECEKGESICEDAPQDTHTKSIFTFSLENGNSVTLYYQAIVQKKENASHLGLYFSERDIPERDIPEGEIPERYIPDFILKYTKGTCTRYGVFDAKWKAQKGKYGILDDGTWEDMRHKYVQGIRTMDEKMLSLFWLLQGKPTQQYVDEAYYHYTEKCFVYHVFEGQQQKKIHLSKGVLPCYPQQDNMEVLQDIIQTFIEDA